jgi:hypothetical protein
MDHDEHSEVQAGFSTFVCELWEAGRYDDAEALCEALVQLAPGWVHPWLGLASARERRGDLDGADRALVAACRLRPEDPEPFLRRTEVAVARAAGESAEDGALRKERARKLVAATARRLRNDAPGRGQARLRFLERRLDTARPRELRK